MERIRMPIRLNYIDIRKENKHEEIVDKINEIIEYLEEKEKAND